MEDDVAPIDELGEQRLVVDGVDEVFEAGTVLEGAMLSIDPVERLSRISTSSPLSSSFGEMGSDNPAPPVIRRSRCGVLPS